MSVAHQLSAPLSIDDDVEWLTEQIQQLKAFGEGGEVSGGQIYDFSIRWGTALAGRLPRLMHYSALGMLDAADETRVRALCTQLRELSDLIDRFKLARPDFSEPPPATGKHYRAPRRRR